MKRNTISKRAVSCIVALALVLSCILTSYAGSVIDFLGDSGTGQGEVKVTTNGGLVEYDVGDQHNSTQSQYIESPPLGTKCRFEAVDANGRVFVYWVDEYSGRVFSYDRVVEFTVGSRMHLRAQFTRESATKHYVSYVNYGGTIMTNNSYTVGSAVSVPTDTKIPGFTFTGWSKAAGDVAADADNQIVFPQYTVNDESYTVMLTNEDYVSGAGTYSNFQTVNLKADEKNGSGESFSYWKDADGAIVSYERNYSFRINYNVTLTAVFGESVTPEPVIRITKINRDEADMKLTFYAERSVPEAYTVVSHGMLMATGSGVSDAQMTVNGAGDSTTSVVRKVYGTSNEPCGTFSLAKAKVSYTTVVVARPFVICQNTEGKQVVVYGDIVRTTNGATD